MNNRLKTRSCQIERFSSNISHFRQVIASLSGSHGVRRVLLHTSVRGLDLATSVDQYLGQLVVLVLRQRLKEIWSV